MANSTARAGSAACRAIEESDLPLSEIAASTGFVDHSHFTRTFRRVIGVSPSGYRDDVARQRIVIPGRLPVDIRGTYAIRSRTAHGEPYDGEITITREGREYRGVVRTGVMPDVSIDTLAVHGDRLVMTGRVPAGLAVLDLRLRGAELEGSWRLAGRGTMVKGRRVASETS